MTTDPRSGRASPVGDGSPKTVDARRLPSGLAQNRGEFSFTVLEEAPPTGSPEGDRRRHRRQRTRLRSGKVTDRTGRFLTECLLHDLSPRGGRLRIPSAVVIPSSIWVFDDQTSAIHRASVLWRRDREIGVMLEPAAGDALSRAIAADMRRRFYAVRD